MGKKYTNFNEPQQKTIDELLRILPGAHMTDVRVRIDGQDKWFEADWLYAVLREIDEPGVVGHSPAHSVTNLKQKG